MTDRKPTLCVVAGPNGSGKTTTTVQLLNNEWTADSLYINPDNIAQEMFGDWNSPEAVVKAAEYATKLRYECLEQRRDFVFETVFSSDVERAYVYDNSIDNSCHGCSIVRLMDSSLSNMWRICRSGLGCC